MGGKSSSSTSSNTTTETRNTNENISGIEDSEVFSDVGSVNILDGGAIDSAFDFADSSSARSFDFGENSLNFAGEGLEHLLDFGSEIAAGSNKQLANTLQSVTSAAGVNANLNQQGLNDTLLKVAYAIAGVTAIFFVVRSFK